MAISLRYLCGDAGWRPRSCEGKQMRKEQISKTTLAELAVIGGGPAGVTAAISAARLGIDTVLVTNRPVLGGNSSSEIRVWTRGAAGAGNLYAEEMGVWGALKLENLYKNPDANVVFWDEILLDAVLRQEHLRLFLNTDISELELEHANIKAVLGARQSTQEMLRIEAQYFLDATGDGVLGALAGVPYEQGPDCMGSSLLYQTRREDHSVPFIPPSFAAPQEEIEQILGNGGRILNENMSGSDCWWFELGGNMDTIRDAVQIDLRLRRLVMGVWNYVKNSGKFDADNCTLEWVGNLPGKRESRRMVTEYMLTEQDVRAQRVFPDTAFYGGWYLDSHPAEGAFSQEANCVQPPVPVYGIPFRSLYNRNFPNLLFAGRNIGTERGAYVSTRVMNTCALSGQAAAALIWECLKTEKAPVSLSQEEIRAAQSALWREDMLLPGITPADSDLAALCRVTASSAADGKAGTQSGTMSLREGGFVCYPGLDASCYLEVQAKQETELIASLHTSALPHRAYYGAAVSEHRWSVPVGRSIIRLPAMGGCFCTLKFVENTDAEICTTEKHRAGFLCGKKDSAIYQEPRLWYDAAKSQTLYAAQNVCSGEHRVWNAPNLWQSAPDDLQPELTLSWEKPASIQEIRLYLDPDLLMELPSSRTAYIEPSHIYEPRRGMPAHLIRSMAVTAFDEREVPLAVWKIEENIRRLLVLQLNKPQKISKLTVTLRSTWGQAELRIFRISAFEQCLTERLK